MLKYYGFKLHYVIKSPLSYVNTIVTKPMSFNYTAVLFLFTLTFINHNYSFVFGITYSDLFLLVGVGINLDLFSVTISIFTSLTSVICYFLFKRYSISVHRVPLFIFILVSIFVILLVQSNNILSFFIYYESILILSVSIVWLSSPNRRSKQTALYFLFWTQSGSFLVFLGSSVLYFYTGVIYFSDVVLLYSGLHFSWYVVIASALIFVGFSIKIPLWPFHFWLTKTHVEASTGFSIFLSGILVKTALLGLIKFKFVFILLNEYLVFILVSYGMWDVSMKLYSQVDFKKLIAYSTIQEMGLLVALVAFDSQYTRLTLVYFCFFHTAISGLLFYISDVIYRRFGSRQLNNVSGLITTHPKLFLHVMFALILFMGFPMTVKFYIELQVIFKLIYGNAYVGVVFVVFVQYLSMLFFFKQVIIFLMGPVNNTPSVDVTMVELVYIYTFILIILILSVC